MFKSVRRPIFLVLVLSSAQANAGMPSFRFSDVARIRVEDLSFFLLLFLVCALVIKWLWNLLARDFSKLPRLKYGRALALTTLLGLCSLLILSMISGARELLTPGAWQRQGSTHRLTDPANDPLRRKSIEVLRASLWTYAEKHDGKFPVQDFAKEIPEEMWQAPDEAKTRFVYIGGLSKNTTPRTVLVFEPLAFGESRFVLFTNGEIAKLKPQELASMLPTGTR